MFNLGLGCIFGVDGDGSGDDKGYTGKGVEKEGTCVKERGRGSGMCDSG